MIVDAHVHVFQRLRCPASSPLCAYEPTYDATGALVSVRSRSAVGEASAERANRQPFRYTAEMLLGDMKSAGVDQAVLLQAPAYGVQNDCALAAVERYPGRFLAATYLDPWGNEDQPALTSALPERGINAAKIEFSENFGLCSLHPDARLDAPSLQDLWRELSRRRLVLVLDLGTVGSRSYQTEAVRHIAEINPQLHIVICHLAKPTPAAEANPELWNLWQEQISLGRLQNVWFDAAALPALNRRGGFPYPDAGRYLRMAMDMIGPEKILWGTDFPTLIEYATYPRLLELARLHTPFLSAAEQELFLGENALRVYRP